MDDPSNYEAQTAMEMVIILAMTLVVLIAVIAVSQDVVGITKQDIKSSMIDSALGDLETAARTVHMQGTGAKTQVYIELPSGIDSMNISNQTLELILNNGEKRYRAFDFNIIGGFNTIQGTHKIPIEAVDTQLVRIGNPVCGNGMIESGEECDGSNLDGETCESLGYDGGNLSCSGCSFDTSQCYNYGYWLTDTEVEWSTGTFDNTTTDGSGNLVLNGSAGGNVTETADSETINTGNLAGGTVSNTRLDDGSTKAIGEENVGSLSPQYDLEIDEYFNTTFTASSVDKIVFTTNSWRNQQGGGGQGGGGQGGGETFEPYIYDYSTDSYIDTGININTGSDGTTYTASICSSGCDITDDPSNYINSTGNMQVQYLDTTSDFFQTTFYIDYQAINLFQASQYPSKGIYNSTRFNAGKTVNWNASAINATTPTNTGYSIDYAENSTGTWSYYSDITNVNDSQHLLFNTTLTGNSTVTPKINYVNITYLEYG